MCLKVTKIALQLTSFGAHVTRKNFLDSSSRASLSLLSRFVSVVSQPIPLSFAPLSGLIYQSSPFALLNSSLELPFPNLTNNSRRGSFCSHVPELFSTVCLLSKHAHPFFSRFEILKRAISSEPNAYVTELKHFQQLLSSRESQYKRVNSVAFCVLFYFIAENPTFSKKRVISFSGKIRYTL